MNVIINPLNKAPIKIDGELIFDDDVINQVPYALKIISIYTFLLILIGSILIKSNENFNNTNT